MTANKIIPEAFIIPMTTKAYNARFGQGFLLEGDGQIFIFKKFETPIGGSVTTHESRETLSAGCNQASFGHS
jgi:hypothetical protein